MSALTTKTKEAGQEDAPVELDGYVQTIGRYRPIIKAPKLRPRHPEVWCKVCGRKHRRREECKLVKVADPHPATFKRNEDGEYESVEGIASYRVEHEPTGGTHSRRQDRRRKGEQGSSTG